jgi:hypothetical protein
MSSGRMKVLRVTPMPDPHSFDLTMVVPEDSVDGSLEDSVEDAITTQAKDSRIFVYWEILDLPGGLVGQSLSTVQVVAAEDRRRISDMAILYYWAVGMFRLMNRGGVLGVKDPAPLTPGDVELVLKQLASHPDRNDVTVVVPSADGGVVMLDRDGTVTKQTA